MLVFEVAEKQHFMFLCLFEKLFTAGLNRPKIGQINWMNPKMRLHGSIKRIYL